MLSHLATLLALAVVAAADPSAEVCASGTCPSVKGPFKASMLLQSRSLKSMGKSVVEEPPDPVIPPEVARKIVVERNQKPRESLTDKVQAERWIDMTHFDSKDSVSPTARKKMHDGNPNTHGGAIEVRLDMGQVFKFTKTRADFRACQCHTVGSVMFAASMDNKNWYTYWTPKVHAWGDHQLYTWHHHALRARYLKIWVTSLAAYHYLGLWDFVIWGREDPTSHPNVYGWWHSYRAGVGGLSGTEIVQLTAYQGKLFGGTGYWMHDAEWRAAEVVRLDCPFCDWVIESVIFPYAGRTEILKSLEWTTDKNGNKLGQPVPKLVGGFYVNYNGEGRCYASVRDDATLEWHLEVYHRGPFVSNHFSARALQLYQDTVTGVDMLFFNAGMDGIVSGTYDPSTKSKVKFAARPESGSASPCRPLALAVMDKRLFFSAASKIKRRVNGGNAKWELVWDELNVDDVGTVDEAVGGIRGLVGITSSTSPTGQGLLFNWAPNGRSQACMVRLDPKANGNGFDHVREKCVKEMAGQYLGNNVDNLTPKVTYSLADYNFALELPASTGDLVHIIGYQILLFAYSCTDFPTDTDQTRTAASGKLIGYYAGAGYLIRRGPNSYEARAPGGKRYDPSEIFPKLVAVRSLVQSPWPNDLSVYMGGYDCNFFPSLNTAWIMSSGFGPVFEEPVPCQPELGCGHTPGDEFRVHGCDWCGFRQFEGTQFVKWHHGRALTCQDNMNTINTYDLSTTEGQASCQTARYWPSEPICCKGERCDFCSGMDGVTFQVAAVAGQSSDGSSYDCKSALDYTDAGHTTCRQAQRWWGAACCK